MDTHAYLISGAPVQTIWRHKKSAQSPTKVTALFLQKNMFKRNTNTASAQTAQKSVEAVKDSIDLNSYPSSGGWDYFKGRGCPICRDTRKDCRTNNGLIFCRETSASPAGYVPRGFDVKGFQMWAAAGSQNSKGFGGISITQEQREKYAAESAARRAAAEARDLKIANGLTEAERDAQYSTILERGLTAFDKRRLREQRGLSAADIQYWDEHKLVGSWFSASNPELITANLPGALPNEPGAIKDHRNMFIPARSAAGLIRGGQLAGTGDQPKYFWASSEREGGNGPALRNGELPIGVYYPKALRDTYTVYACEGLLKPQLAAYRHGVVFLGAAGGQFDTPNQLRADLAYLEAETVIFTPDGGAVVNPDVMRTYGESVATFKAVGVKVEFLWWGQLAKADGDVDEIPTEVFAAATRISWDEFLAISKQHMPAEEEKPAATPAFAKLNTASSIGDKPAKKAKTKSAAALKTLEAREANRKKLKADAAKWMPQIQNAIELTGQYIGDAIAVNLKPGIQAYSAPTGTGKTTGYRLAIEKARAAGFQIIYLTKAESQAKDGARDFQLSYRKESNGFEVGASFAACYASVRVDSINVPWLNILVENSIVIVDEVASLLDELVTSPEPHQAHKLALAAIFSRCQTLIVGDANLKQHHVDALERLSGKPSEVYALRKTSQPTTITVIADPDGAKSRLANYYGLHLWDESLKAGTRSFVVTNGMKGSSTVGTVAMGEWAKLQHGIIINRVDGQSTKDPANPAFNGNADFNAVVAAHMSTVVSPANSTGKNYHPPADLDIAITLDSGFGTVTQAIQDGGRSRTPATKGLFACLSSSPNGRKFGGTTDPLEVIEQIVDRYNTPIGQQLRYLVQARDVEALAAIALDDPWLVLEAEIIAQRNAELADKPGNYARYMELIGHTVKRMAPVESDEFTQFFCDYKAHKGVSETNWHDSISSADHLTRDQAKAIRKTNEWSQEVDFQLRRRSIVDAERLEIREYIDEDGKVKELDEPYEPVALDGQWVKQLEKDRMGKKYRMHCFLDADNEALEADAYRTVKAAGGISHRLLVSLPAQVIAQLKNYGFHALTAKYLAPNIDVMALVEQLELELGKEKPNANKANSIISGLCAESRFSKNSPEMVAIVERLALGRNFETLCNRIGVASQRNDDGTVDHKQVLTILRQVFGFKSFYSHNIVNGQKGCYILSSDDAAAAVATAYRRTAKLHMELRLHLTAEGAANPLRDALKTHRRNELFPTWQQQHTINKAILEAASDKDRMRSASFIEGISNHYINDAEQAESIGTATLEPLDTETSTQAAASPAKEPYRIPCKKQSEVDALLKLGVPMSKIKLEFA
jgi:hypothetical protein